MIERGNAGLESPGRVRTGRPPRYCSDACKTRAYRARQAETRYDEPSVHDLVSAMRDALTRLERAAHDAEGTATRPGIGDDLAILTSNTRALRRLLAADSA